MEQMNLPLQEPNETSKILAFAVQRFLTLRANIKAQEADMKEALRPERDEMERLQTKLHTFLRKQGVESIRTEQGTIYEVEKTSATVEDKIAFIEYIREKDMYELLDIKANKIAVREHTENFDGLPPGIKWTSFHTVNIRTSK